MRCKIIQTTVSFAQHTAKSFNFVASTRKIRTSEIGFKAEKEIRRQRSKNY